VQLLRNASEFLGNLLGIPKEMAGKSPKILGQDLAYFPWLRHIIHLFCNVCHFTGVLKNRGRETQIDLSRIKLILLRIKLIFLRIKLIFQESN